jgi:phenylacetate-CoA ligase
MDINYWGANLERFSSIDKRVARQELGLQPNGPVILSSRAIEPRLNIHRIVGAMPGVLARLPDAMLLIIGRSSPEYLRNVKSKIDELGVGSHLRLLDEVEQAALPAYYNASDVVVSMANSEGFPNTILEVMGCEVPVVAGRIPQLEELLENGVHATICEIEEDAIAEAILSVFDQPDRAMQMVKTAKELVVQNADITKNGGLFADRVRMVCREAKPPSWFRTLIFRFAFVTYLALRKFK